MHNAYGIAISVRGDPWTNRTPLGGEQSTRWSLPHFLLIIHYSLFNEKLGMYMPGFIKATFACQSIVSQAQDVDELACSIILSGTSCV